MAHIQKTLAERPPKDKAASCLLCNKNKHSFQPLLHLSFHNLSFLILFLFASANLHVYLLVSFFKIYIKTTLIFVDFFLINRLLNVYHSYMFICWIYIYMNEFKITCIEWVHSVYVLLKLKYYEYFCYLD